jgi:hypothetical protein
MQELAHYEKMRSVGRARRVFVQGRMLGERDVSALIQK